MNRLRDWTRQAAKAFLRKFASIIGQGQTQALLVSHSMEEIAHNATRIVVLDDAHIAMDGTPREVFARAQELMDIGLGVPGVTKIAMALRARGLAVDPAVYTIEELKQQLLRLKGGGAGC